MMDSVVTFGCGWNTVNDIKRAHDAAYTSVNGSFIRSQIFVIHTQAAHKFPVQM